MKKFTRVFEDDFTTETWTYDYSISSKGPINVDIKYKKGYDKDWLKRQKAVKQITKIERKNNKK